MSENNELRRLQELGNEERMKLDALLVEERQRYDQLNSNQITLRIEKAELQDENYNLTEEVMRLTDANDNVRENIMQLQGQLNEVTASRDDITERYQRLKQKLTRMRLQFQELEEVSENNWHIMAGEINDIFEKLSNDKGLMSVSLKKEFRNIMENINIDCVQALCAKWYDAVASKKRKDIDEDKATLKKAKTDNGINENVRKHLVDEFDDDATTESKAKTGEVDVDVEATTVKDDVDVKKTGDEVDDIDDDATTDKNAQNVASKDVDATTDENAKTCNEVEADVTEDQSASDKDDIDIDALFDEEEDDDDELLANNDESTDEDSKTRDEVEDVTSVEKIASKDEVDVDAGTPCATPVTKGTNGEDEVDSPEY